MFKITNGIPDSKTNSGICLHKGLVLRMLVQYNRSCGLTSVCDEYK